MKTKYIIIDNFLDQEEFERMSNSIMTGLEWFYNDKIAHDEEEKSKNFFMHHDFYGSAKNPVNALERFLTLPMSPALQILDPMLNKLNPGLVIRIKGNLYPNTPELVEHDMHSDFRSHQILQTDVLKARGLLYCGGVFSLNTCDGYTKLNDGTKVNSVANRMLIFDSSEPHCSTNTTNVAVRWTIITNFLGHKGVIE